jgi:hypothetical protein
LGLGIPMRIEKTLPELIRDAKCDLSSAKTVLHDVVHTVSKSIINKQTQKPWHVFDLTEIKNETMLDICQTMITDFPFKAMATNHAHWMTSGQKLFKISDDFFDIFSKVSLGNIQANALPDDMCGYCILPRKIEDQSGDSYDGFYFYSGPGEKYLGAEGKDWTKMMNGLSDREIQNVNRVLNLAWLDSKGHLNYCTMPFNGEELLKDVFVNTKFVLRRPVSDELMEIHQEMQDDGFLPHIRIMCNLLIYLNSGNPDLRSYRNEIKYQSPTSQTPVKKDKSLSQMEFTLVGFGFKKNPLYSKEFFVQPPYWAHRLHGPGRTLKKYMLVKGSLKKRNAELLNQEKEAGEEIYL